MRVPLLISCFSACVTLGVSSAYAGNPPVQEQLQIPQRLYKHLATPYEILAENKEFKIINIPSKDIDVLAQVADKVHCGRYVNVSHKITTQSSNVSKAAQNLLAPKRSIFSKKPKKYVYEIKHEAEVNNAIEEINENNIWNTLIHLTTYHNRSAKKDTGVEAATWLKEQFEQMAKDNNRTDTETYTVKTGWYKQPSVVTVIGKNLKGPAVVIGAHMDTLDGRMPGAGDDGSGSSSIMEAARVLLSSKMNFKHPIYIIWYAAEERGLVGSQYVVEHFQDKNIPVKGVVQFDMTGYRVNPSDPTMWVFTDHVDKNLSDYLVRLINTYIHVPVAYSECGYGCSDHASWDDQGYPAAFPCESNFEDHNPDIHSEYDTMDKLSKEHMANFAKLALAFAMELAAE